MLTNEAATRIAIIDALKSLKADKRINPGDPILIVYAGHGTQIEAPSGWETGGEHLIQALVPFDCCSTTGLEIPCIPDRTIGALLESIAETKGNNITVVLDCCHAASGTRAGTGGLRIRSVALKPSPIHTQDLDLNIWDAGFTNQHPVPHFRYRGLRSHILLAACRSFERATETKGHGKFSRALLKLLRATPPDELRYSQILFKLDVITDQNPQLEGVEQERFLFGAPIQAPTPSIYPIFYDEQSCLHFTPVGTAQGVTQGSTFDLIPETNVRDLEAVTNGSFIVLRAMSFISTLTPQSNSQTITGPLTIRRSTEGQKYPIRLFISQDRYPATRSYLDGLLRDQTHGLRDCIIVDDPSEAHFQISINRGKAIFNLLDEAARKYGFRYRYPRIDAHHDNVSSFLKAAQKYYTELYQTSDDGSSFELIDDLEVSCFQLHEKASTLDDVSQLDMVTIGQDLCEYEKIDLVVKADSYYGFKIVNHGNRDLYPTLSYFDFRDLGTITSWYKAPSSGPYQLEAPLKKYGGSLTIGYGNGGALPVMFSLQEDQEIAVGFLKISVSTQPVHMFDPLYHLSNYQQNLQSFLSENIRHTWGSKLIPIIQRRRPKETPTDGFHFSYWPHTDPVTHVIGAHAMSRRTTSMPIRFVGAGRA
ncbi:hypothetical protein JR316_0010987 [Psilocybe cubensis]|uniref:Uncharacterized protein n=2 Tax=Psilocybe cubensis TaxID=181762 RepID=A0ACB8GPC4_PSICU|nr:hypothetical protein JR316_0010987 [Psilocybe cubensis]KAH9477071.1 hypothetical protein JR316_0010987 [Psilocybe cubensis]